MKTTIRTDPSNAATRTTRTKTIRQLHKTLVNLQFQELCYYFPNILLGFRRPSTPLSDPPSPSDEPSVDYSNSKNASDTEEDSSQADAAKRKPVGFQSRIEQILHERHDLQIIITHAGKNQEGGGSYIAYTIRTGVCAIQ